MSVAHRVPPGWRQIIEDLEQQVEIVDAYEDDWSGDLIIRALLDDMRDQRLVAEAAAKAAISCRECGKPGRLRGNRIVCRDHSPGDPWQRIIRNSARCLACGDEIESTHRHDFVRCRCGKLAVDGGHAYLKRLYDPASRWQETSIEEVVMPFSGFRHNGMGDDIND
ncbi:MAG: hypothetical protein CML24_09795 [Rhizobiales bacterium]|nr:hypothetical protein [Hyphomicrobiales bacterium]|tara:strand:+ start:11338 stop:11835 length:498 start_codon:yes stop_codon:yes gene_type:complete